MPDRITHVKQDEWSHGATKTAARRRIKRARQKAKRALTKKTLKKDLQDL